MEAETKTCKHCAETKPHGSFTKCARYADGLQNQCKDCKNAYSRKTYNTDPYTKETQVDNRKRRAARNRKYVYDLLKVSKCIDCDDTRWQVLEFDHVRGEKRDGISNMVCNGMAIATIEAEIAKCEIRCSNCHKLVTWKRMGCERGE